jgi:hypothetical protein
MGSVLRRRIELLKQRAVPFPWSGLRHSRPDHGVVLLPMLHESIAGILAGQPQRFSFFQDPHINLSEVSFHIPFSDTLLSIQVEF